MVICQSIASRSRRAAEALKAGGQIDCPFEGCDVADLVGDLCHLADLNGWNAAEILTSGLSAYGATCVEEAWGNDQCGRRTRPESVLEVEQVLHERGVHRDLHDGIFLMLGMSHHPRG